MLKVYCDGSGNSRSTACRYLTLSGIFASDLVWRALEDRWAAALEKHGVPYSHMSELLSSEGPFAKWKGKDQGQKKIALTNDLLSCLWHKDRASFFGCSVTVDLSEYRKFSGPRLKPVGAVCVDVCMTHAFEHPEYCKGRTEVFFDKNEEFIHWIERLWNRNKSKADSWAGYISTIAPAEMRDVIPIQVADLLAWSTNRKYASGVGDFWGSANMMIALRMNHFHALYGREDLIRHPSFLSFNRRI